MFLPSDLIRTEREKVRTKLFVQLPVDLLLSELIEELMRECLSRIQSLFGRVDHDLADEVKKQRICLWKDLHKKGVTLFHSLFFTFGNL